jgi:tetratricopeptide (TPR) repeat protein
MRQHARLALLLGLLVTQPAFSPARAADGPRERESIQDFLNRLRSNRDGIVNELRGGVEALVRTLEQEAVSRNLDALEAARTRLVALGPESAPLLVELIDPGAQSTDAQKLRAQYVTLALSDLKSRAVTQRLIELAQAGSVDGRVNAIQLLGMSPEPDRAGPVLVGLFRGNHGELKQAAMIALARLGGDANDKILDEGLADAKHEIVDATLDALAQAHKSSMAPRVLKLLAAPSEAVHHLDKLLGYYRACPEAVDKAALTAWIHVVQEISATVEDRTRILEFLPTFADRFDNDTKKELRQMTESQTKELREGALVVLVLVGDKNARRELLAEYDDQIDRNPKWPNSFTARGSVLYRIADYREAINDFKKAIQLSAEDLRARQDDAYIGLAKSYAMTNKLKEAAQTIERAPLTAKQIAALKKDPAFAKMVENPKFQNVFNPK